MTAKTVHVIPHTHWDYEWYFTHPESSVQLTYHMDDVFKALDEEKLNQYLLDGQSSIVEDYIELAPQSREKLESLIKANRLKIGPWYTQCDQLIISGESIVRNLLIGSQVAESFGASWNIGYVPDAFGQSIDMPKIYNGFGIQNSVFWRGLSSDKCPDREFVWTSEDGSKVNCYQIRNGYYLAEPQIASMPPDDIISMISPGVTQTDLPLPYGADQIKVDFDLKDRIASLNQNSDAGHHFIESNYNELFHKLASSYQVARTYQGEMIDAEFSKIHRSIYSTRYDHKRLNDQVETRLTYQLEPLMALANRVGIPYKHDLLTSIWKTILRCHAHDSAGGCNSDRTNYHIKHRLITADEMSTANVDYLTRKLSESLLLGTRYDLALINTLPYQRQEPAVVELDTQTPYFELLDEAGNQIDYTLCHSEKVYHGTIKRTVAEQDESLCHYHHKIEFKSSIPPMGWKLFEVKESDSSPVEVGNSHTSIHASIENEFYQVSIIEGKVQITDRSTSRPTTLTVRDIGDDGDNYDYSPPREDWELKLDFADNSSSVVKTSHSETLTLQGHWVLPKDLDERDKKIRSTSIDYTLTLKLRSGDSTLDASLSLNNNVKDHRMQLIADSAISSGCSIADTPFGVVTRPHAHSSIDTWREKGWKEEPSSIYPMIHSVSIHDQHSALTLFSKGIKEYETFPDHKGRVALTLFRAIGWLGKPELIRRPGIASGQQFKYIATPDSQLLGTLEFNFALTLTKQFNAAHVMKTWQSYAVPVLAYHQQNLNRFTNTMKYFGINTLQAKRTSTSGFLHIDAPQLTFSALKHAEKGNGLIVRIYNPNEYLVTNGGCMTFSDEIEECYPVDLSETTQGSLNIIGERLDLGEFKPKQIKSYLVKFSQNLY